MKLNSKLTGGLAWAGVLVVLAVPAADLVTGGHADSTRVVTSDVDPTRTGGTSTSPATDQAPATETASVDDPVEAYISSGRELPSYISDAPATAAVKKPAATVKLVSPSGGAAPTGGAGAQTQVAALPAAQAVAPVPAPRPVRPRWDTATVAPVAPAGDLSDSEAPLILEEDLIERRNQAVAAVLDDEPGVRTGPTSGVVSGRELEEWDSGSLAEYLRQRGMLNDGGAEPEPEVGSFGTDSGYDEDGFYLDEGPNGTRSRARVIRRDPFYEYWY